MQQVKNKLVDLLADKQINPNLLTFLGLTISIFAATAFAYGLFKLAGLCIIVAGAFDILDGSVARKSGRVSSFGAFFDSVIDRYSDLILYIGLIMFFARINAFGSIVLTSVASMASILVSYSRARAENFIDSCKVGFWERPERIVLLIIGAFSGKIVHVLWILALLANLTVIHRIVHTWFHTNRSTAIPEPSERISSTVVKILFWDYERGTWQYDIYCLIVIGIVFADNVYNLIF